MHRLDRMHGIPAVPARRPKTEFCAQSIKKIRAWLFPDTHRAIALHVAMTTDRTQTRAGLSHLSAQQHQVDDLLDIGDRILMLSQAHGPAKDYPLGLDKDSRGIFDFDFRDSRLFKDIAPMAAAMRRLELFKPRRVAIYEFMIQYATWPALFSVEQFFHDSFLQVRINGDVALLKGIMKELFDAEERRPGSVLDHEFINSHTTGFEEFKAAHSRSHWGDILEQSGITKVKIEDAARIFIESERVIFCWAMGLTQHKNAVANIEEIVNLMLLRGQMGKPGAGLCPV